MNFYEKFIDPYYVFDPLEVEKFKDIKLRITCSGDFMDAQKRSEIEEKVKVCKLKIANESAKLQKYEMQLAVGKSSHTKPRVKTEQKQGKPAPKAGEKQKEVKKEMGFIETIFS